MDNKDIREDEVFNPDDFSELDFVTLTDNEGNEMECEFLGEVKFAGKFFLLMSPVDEREDEDDDEEAYSVVIFEVIGNEEEGESYALVEDGTLMESVFELFKEENKDQYDFL